MPLAVRSSFTGIKSPVASAAGIGSPCRIRSSRQSSSPAHFSDIIRLGTYPTKMACLIGRLFNTCTVYLGLLSCGPLRILTTNKLNTIYRSWLTVTLLALRSTYLATLNLGRLRCTKPDILAYASRLRMISGNHGKLMASSFKPARLSCVMA